MEVSKKSKIGIIGVIVAALAAIMGYLWLGEPVVVSQPAVIEVVLPAPPAPVVVAPVIVDTDSVPDTTAVPAPK